MIESWLVPYLYRLRPHIIISEIRLFYLVLHTLYDAQDHKTILMLHTQEPRRPFDDIIYSHRRPLRNTTVSSSKHMDSHYSTPLSCASFLSAVAAATAAFSSPSLALTLMQSMGSMLLKSASRIAASAARPRYECRISVNEL